MRSRALALTCGVLLALLLPATALAQSAGDEQYSDPFAGQSPSSGSHFSPPSSSSPSSPSSSSPSQVPRNSPSSGSTGQLASAGSQSPDASASSSGLLARTGLNTWSLALVGALMLLSGILLRLRLRPPRPAAGGAAETLGHDVRLGRRLRRRR